VLLAFGDFAMASGGASMWGVNFALVLACHLRLFVLLRLVLPRRMAFWGGIRLGVGVIHRST
jgi:hypothetical protein